MWFSVISSLICFAIATILFTPPFRKCRFYKEMSFFFLFNVSWTILSLAVSEIWPKYNFMTWVNYIGTIVFGGYLLYKLIKIYNSDSKDIQSQASDTAEKEDKSNSVNK